MQHKQNNRFFTYVASVATVAIAAALIAVGAPTASAADGTVNVPAGTDTYSPATTSLNPGDTITWRNSGVHDIKSARIPAGAKAWSSPIQQGAATFSQTPTVTGNYRYFCSLHSNVAAANAATQDTTQMVGQFTVAGGAAPAPAPAPGPAPAPAPAPKGDAPATGDAQVGSVPSGGVQSGGGSTAGPTHVSLLMLGGGLLIAAMMSALLGLRITRKD